MNQTDKAVSRLQSGAKFEHFKLFDMTASQRRKADPRAQYRERLLTKLTRTVRMTFYGFQLFGTSILLAIFVISGHAHVCYLSIVTTVTLGFVILVVLSLITKNRWRAKYHEIPPEDFSNFPEEPFDD